MTYLMVFEVISKSGAVYKVKAVGIKSQFSLMEKLGRVVRRSGSFLLISLSAGIRSH